MQNGFGVNTEIEFSIAHVSFHRFLRRDFFASIETKPAKVGSRASPFTTFTTFARTDPEKSHCGLF
jgi:hypothetical protein